MSVIRGDSEPHGRKIFTSTGKFNVPVGVNTVLATVVGAGGGGGGGSTNGGAGGGGAGQVVATEVPVTGGQEITITIGSGGTGAPNAPASAGGSTTFGSYLTAVGGRGGAAGGSMTGGAGGRGSLSPYKGGAGGSVNSGVGDNDDWSAGGSGGGSATPSTSVSSDNQINTQTNSDNLMWGGIRKTFFANTRWWVFYSDATNQVVRSSTDGSTWSSATTVTTSTFSGTGYSMSLWLQGTEIYYALLSNNTAASFKWRHGTLNSDGSITWNIAETTVTTTLNTNRIATICVDSGGNIWVAAETRNGVSHIEIWRTPDGTNWTKKKDITQPALNQSAIILPSTSGVMVVYGPYFSDTTVEHIITSSDGGANWSTAVATASTYLLNQSNAIVIGDTMHFAGKEQTGLLIQYWKFNFTDTSTPAETVFVSTTNYTGTITYSTSLTSQIVIIGSISTDIKCFISNDSGATWSSFISLFTFANPPIIPNSVNFAIQVSTQPVYSYTPTENLGIAWTENNSGTFSNRFGILTISATGSAGATGGATPAFTGGGGGTNNQGGGGGGGGASLFAFGGAGGAAGTSSGAGAVGGNGSIGSGGGGGGGSLSAGGAGGTGGSGYAIVMW